MERIKTLFQQSKEFATETNDLNKIVSNCKKADNEFRSVAFEAAAMALAEKDLSDNNPLERWRQFLTNHAFSHAAQVHVGLGWALSKNTIKSDKFMDLIEPFMVSRVIDGMGYYDGIFKKRLCFNNKKISDKIIPEHHEYYDQGIGRSIWYKCEGNIIECKELIESFSSTRQPNMWKGIGIASAYIGGCDEKMIQEIFVMADQYQSKLSFGAAMVAKGRSKSETINSDIDKFCLAWLNLTAQETAMTIQKLFSDSKMEGHDYRISFVEKELFSSRLNK